MSHFFVIALLPARVKDVEGRVAVMMAPYSERLDTEPYEDECYCVGDGAKTRARNAADKVGTYDDLRAKLRKSHTAACEERDAMDRMNRRWTKEEKARYAALDAELDAEWAKLCAPRQEAERLAFESDPRRDKPDPKCPKEDGCGGTGVRTTTYNPLSKWDWYVVGGRWDGEIKGTPRESEGGFNFGKDHHQLRYNLVPASELVAKAATDDAVVPFAVLDAEGVWHARAEMGWFGATHGEKASREQWAQSVRELFEAAAKQGQVAVALDCHI